jgi:ABC-type Fe3+-siderophore transport system permease subunit
MMPAYTVLWEKGTKLDLKTLGRKAAEQSGKQSKQNWCMILVRVSSCKGISSLLSGVIELGFTA